MYWLKRAVDCKTGQCAKDKNFAGDISRVGWVAVPTLNPSYPERDERKLVPGSHPGWSKIYRTSPSLWRVTANLYEQSREGSRYEASLFYGRAARICTARCVVASPEGQDYQAADPTHRTATCRGVGFCADLRAATRKRRQKVARCACWEVRSLRIKMPYHLTVKILVPGPARGIGLSCQYLRNG